MTTSLVDMLKRENDELREQVAHLKKCLIGTETVFLCFGFTALEYRVFSALMEREALSKDQILSITYADRVDVDVPDLKIVDVFICRIRKKLKPFGISIETLWGRGYHIQPAMKDLARQIGGARPLAPARAA